MGVRIDMRMACYMCTGCLRVADPSLAGLSLLCHDIQQLTIAPRCHNAHPFFFFWLAGLRSNLAATTAIISYATAHHARTTTASGPGGAAPPLNFFHQHGLGRTRPPVVGQKMEANTTFSFVPFFFVGLRPTVARYGAAQTNKDAINT